MNILGARLKSLRKQKDLSQDEVARLTGYSRVQISNWEINRSEPDIQALGKLAAFFAVSIDYLTGKVDSPTDSLVPTSTEPLDPTIERIGYTDPSPAAQKIADAIDSDPELLAFWKDVSQRPDLQLLCRQTKSMTPETIRKVMRIIKAIEEEEANED